MRVLPPQAWAEFKGKLADGGQENPAAWKTRLRCALNKSTEFEEVMERAQLDISEPYKVYRLVPLSEQGELLSSQRLPHRVRGGGEEFHLTVALIQLDDFY